MSAAITTTVDAAGRVVVPKRMRDRLGLRAGSQVEIADLGDRLEITPTPGRYRIEQRDGHAVLVPQDAVVALTADQVREVLDATRDRR